MFPLPQMPELLEKAAFENGHREADIDCDNQDEDKEAEEFDNPKGGDGDTSSDSKEEAEDVGADETKQRHPTREKNESSEAKKVRHCLFCHCYEQVRDLSF